MNTGALCTSVSVTFAVGRGCAVEMGLDGRVAAAAFFTAGGVRMQGGTAGPGLWEQSCPSNQKETMLEWLPPLIEPGAF